MKRIALPALTLGLVAALAGCGGPPTDASKADFCQIFTDMDQANTDTNDEAAALKLVKEAADRFEKVGTPSNIPDSARSGFEFTIEKIQGIDKMSDIDAINKDLSSQEQKDIDAFTAYQAKECGGS